MGGKEGKTLLDIAKNNTENVVKKTDHRSVNFPGFV